MPIHKLTRSGDSYQVTIPVAIARRWIQDDVVAVEVEWVPPSVVITPITLRGLHALSVRSRGEEDPGADHHP